MASANPFTMGLGMSVRVANALDLVAEVYGGTYTNNFFAPTSTPLEAIGGLKIFVVANSYLMIGAGRRPDRPSPAPSWPRGMLSRGRSTPR
jgi:hypothetical protein